MLINSKSSFICFGLTICLALTYHDSFMTIIDSLAKYWKRNGYSCGDWEMYRNDKCLKVFDTLENFENAQQFCNKLDKHSELISIRSQKEHEFIMNYLSKVGIFDDTWIGAKRDQKNRTNFIYQDESSVEYTNWDPIEQQKSSEDCLVLQVNSNQNKRTSGNWKVVSCKKRNLILCQYMIDPSNVQLNVKISDLRDNFEDNAVESEVKIKKLSEHLGKSNSKIGDLKNDLSLARIKIADLTQSLSDSKKTIDKLRKDSEEQTAKYEELNNKGLTFFQYITIVGITIFISFCCIGCYTNSK